ncbi:MAG: hypothetical protein ACTHU0_16715 [Kofleriaceae bacterium]
MTAMQLLCVASLAGAALFFAAGAATAALRLRGRTAGSQSDLSALQQRVELAEGSQREVVQQRDAAVSDAARLRAADQTRGQELDQLRRALATAEAAARRSAEAPGDQATQAQATEATNRELSTLRQRADAAGREIAALRARAEAAEAASREVAVLRARAEAAEAASREVAALRQRAEAAEAASREVAALRARAEAADAASREVTTLRARAEAAEAASREVTTLRQRSEAAEAKVTQVSGELERARGELAQLQRGQAAADAASAQLQTAEAKAGQLSGDLERARGEAAAATRELRQLESRLRDAERQLAERVQAVRDLSTENEQLKGRVNDAEGLRADYVRLRTTATESEFLKSEVARLEEALREAKVGALGTSRRRPPRASTSPGTPTGGSIGESLSTVIDRFADDDTRSIAVADTLGFPLASNGDDGLALAAYAALLIESANRAAQFLPMASPSAIEVVDEHGARVSVWTFNVESDRLMLVNLAVAPTDTGRVEATLADLTAILAPTSAAAAG